MLSGIWRDTSALRHFFVRKYLINFKLGKHEKSIEKIAPSIESAIYKLTTQYSNASKSINIINYSIVECYEIHTCYGEDVDYNIPTVDNMPQFIQLAKFYESY